MVRLLLTPNRADSVDRLPAGFLKLLAELDPKYTRWQDQLNRQRRAVLWSSHQGRPPQHSHQQATDWQVQLPEWCLDQRNQMTGPADDPKYVVGMLNSSAPGVMLDVEDSVRNTWEHTLAGHYYAVEALRGRLTYQHETKGVVAIKPSKTVVWFRVRGLHLQQEGVLDHPVSASLFDTLLHCYLLAQEDMSSLRHPVCIYIPKSESAAEALWWADLFQSISNLLGWRPNFIKCMALVESHPMAHQMEEFALNLRDHLVGFNLGRWDYMASLIHFMLTDPNWVLPDRDTIPHDVAFFQCLRRLMVDICHRHGLLAIGGMTALFPSADPEVNKRALEVLERDKHNEASMGMDGAWTGHPGQNAIAVGQFPVPNQVSFRWNLEGEDRFPDLRPQPVGVGHRTLEGTRQAIRVCIQYAEGLLRGKGAVLIDGRMEDQATYRIYMLMVAQRQQHWAEVMPGVSQEWSVLHQLFTEELQRLVAELPTDGDSRRQPEQVARLRSAAELAEGMIRNQEFSPQ